MMTKIWSITIIALLSVALVGSTAVVTAQDSEYNNTTQNNTTDTTQDNNTETIYSNEESSNNSSAGVIGEALPDRDNNIVCENLSTDPTRTPTGELVESVLFLIVSLGAVVAIVFGAGFTLAQAVKPSAGFAEKRNKSIIFGSGTIVMLYGITAVLSQLSDVLDFSCVLPFFGQ